MKNKVQKIKISKAKVSEAQIIRKLEEQVWDEEVTNKYDIPMFIRFGYVYVAKSNNKIVGAIVSYRTNKNEVYVCDLVVDPKYRRQKIGEKLYVKLLNSVKGMNVVSFLDPDLGPTFELHSKLGAKVVRKEKDPYDLNKKDIRLFVKIKN